MTLSTAVRLRAAALSAAVVVVLAGCSADGGDAGPAAAEPTGDDQVVLALDDFAAMHALSLGVRPDLVLEAFEYESTSAVFDDLGIETSAYGSELDLEAVVAAAPDVVIGVSLPTTASVEAQLDEIAPTTVVDYTGTWEEQLASVATALGREDEAAAVTTRLEEQTAEVAAAVEEAGLAGQVVSVVGDNGGFFSPPAATSVGALLSDVGLTRPAAQQVPGQAENPFALFSAETLGDHDGDAILLLSGGAYATAGLTGSPLWPGLSAVADGAVHEVSGEVWLSASAFSASWVLEDLRAVLLDGGEPAAAADAPARFAEFTGA